MEKKKLGGLLLALWLAVLPLYGAMCFADTAADADPQGAGAQEG